MKYQAPGKVVLWGEYAVLAGAAAGVMAVNRFAQASLDPHPQRWLFSSQGLRTPGLYKSQPQFSGTLAARLAETILSYWGYTQLPQPFSLTTDSCGFFIDKQKLGLGSSAAACTATYHALAMLLGRETHMSEIIAIHRKFQGGKGSGLDVAASCHGGLIQFKDEGIKRLVLPSSWHWRVVYSGQPSKTADALGDFNTWRQQADQTPLLELVALSNQTSAHPCLDNLAQYIEALRILDNAARLNIFTPAHSRLATIAADNNVVYKPCGAGGGDVGFACTEDPLALTNFCQQASAEHFIPLDLEMADHGVQAC